MSWSRLRLIDFDNLKFVRGTYRQFGFRDALCLLSPLANIIIHWKRRNAKLKI